jgi:hypothetical protein
MKSKQTDMNFIIHNKETKIPETILLMQWEQLETLPIAHGVHLSINN